MRPVIRFSTAIVLAACAAVALSIGTARAGRRPAPPQASAPGGQTTTRLPDGRWLVVGGQSPDGTPGGAAIVDPATGSRTPVSGFAQPREGHAATMLPDGSVLISGGVAAQGQPATAVELFDPGAGTFVQIAVQGAAQRSGHSATVLTDGRVLVVGGLGSDGQPRRDAELWTLGPDGDVAGAESPRAASVPGHLSEGRARHRATLLPDGRVLIEGGGRRAEAFDANDQQFSPAAPALPDGASARLVESIPADGAVDVADDARIALRFSKGLGLDTVREDTVVVTGPEGAVPAAVVPAEGGRLVFVSPRTALASGVEYVVTLANLAGADGRAVVAAAVRFTTRRAKERDLEVDVDAEAWMPDAESIRNGWKTGRPDSPWQKLAPLLGPPGVTAVSGQALRLDGRPLADVTLEMEGKTARTDRTGRFLLLLPEQGTGWCELLIDGRSASRGQRTYGIFEVGLQVTGGRTTVLPYTIWMPLLDTVHKVAIPSPTTGEVVVRTPRIPGLELHLPPRTVIRDHDGTVVRELTITPIPLDRPPFPLAPVKVPIYFTIQPGAAYVHTYDGYSSRPGVSVPGAWLVYPNSEAWPGKRIQFYHYEPEEKGWYVYGLGTVTPNGAQVVPDKRTRFYEFTGAMINANQSPPADAAPPGDECCNDGDPVNLWTGLFELEQTDLYLPDVLPLALTRTYRTRDPEVRPFGIGATHPYAIFLWSAQEFTQADLILPDGGRIHYVRTSAGTSFSDAVFEHKETETTSATPTAFYKSVLTWRQALNPQAARGWELRLKDGTVYVFGDSAPLQAIRDRYGNTIHFTWSTTNQWGSGSGNLLQLTSPHGRWIKFTYDGSNRIIEAKDNIGRTVGYTYDASGRLWKVTDPLSQVTEYTYDTSHRLLTVKNRNGVVYVTNEYTTTADAPTPVGWVKKQTFADGGTYQFAYTVVNGKSTQTDVTDPRNYVRRVTFNSNGYTLSDTRALGTPEQIVTSSMRPGASNFVTNSIDPVNHQTARTYDDKGNVLAVTRLAGTPDAVTATFTYEPVFNQIATVTDPLNHTTTFEYDAGGRLTGVVDALNHRSTRGYNALGQLTSNADALQHETTFTYLGADFGTEQDPLGRVTTRLTDSAGRLIAVTDPQGRTTKYEYDALDRLTKAIDPVGGETAFAYFPEGQLQRITDARNNSTMYTYTAMGQLETRSDPIGRVEAYEYDNIGNRTNYTDANGESTSATYDPANRPKIATFADGSTVTRTYNGLGRIVTVADSVSGQISRTYDDLGRTISETTPQGSVAYTHDAADRRATMTVAGQPTVSYTYDNADRLTQITRDTSTVTIGYDEADRRLTLVLPNGASTQYVYDDASQVRSMTYQSPSGNLGTLTYVYDSAGNRTSVGGTLARTGLPQAMITASYDAANQLAHWGGTTLTHDAGGNVVSNGLTSLIWNARNKLSEITGATTASFQYDGVGRRTTATIVGTTRNFLYDGVDTVQEITGTVTANRLIGLNVDEAFLRTEEAVSRVPLVDALGSTIALLDSAATVKVQYTYEPFGRTVVSGSAESYTAQYTGRDADASGLYFYRARYYDPELGRFISEDPLRFRGGVNFYSYVLNNPVRFTDPNGLEIPPPGGYKIPPPGPPWVDVPGFWKEFGFGALDMWDRYREMRDRNWQDSAPYFHCMANCEAASRGPGGRFASQVISELREDFDYWKGDTLGETLLDMVVNRCGRRGGEERKNCQKVCAPFIPKSSPGRPVFVP